MTGREEAAAELMAAYSATKSGVIAFIKSLHHEVTNAGIRTTLVEPDIVKTEHPDHVPHDQTRDYIKSGQVSRLAPEEIADNITHAVTRPQNASINEILVPLNSQNRNLLAASGEDYSL